jgi:putative heme iron utilization protein
MPNDHARPSGRAPDAGPEVRAPSHAERCRTLVARTRTATLATITSGRARGAATDGAMERDPAGFPYASLVTVAFDERGRPILFLSELAEHTQNLKAHAEASVLLTDPLDRHPEPLAASRLTLIGPCNRLEAEAERAAARATFLAAQPSAAYYIEFKDFAFYRLDPIALRYVGGFGRMSWVTCDEYAAAEPDPLADAERGILAHMNDDHADAILAYATGLAKIEGASKATMTAVDRYGFEMTVVVEDTPRAVRLAFDEPVATSDEVRRAMVALVKRARG